MVNQQHGPENAPEAVSAEVSPMTWVAPLESMTSFSVAEFTQLDSWPGDDGLGTFTQS